MHTPRSQLVMAHQAIEKPGWECREWERGSRRHVGSAYLHHGPSPPPRVPSSHARSPSQTSPMLTQPSRNYWDSRPTQPPLLQSRSPRAPPPSLWSASGDCNYWQNRFCRVAANAYTTNKLSWRCRCRFVGYFPCQCS
jgi:hypothetical protein